jgi:hypothetical protein
VELGNGSALHAGLLSELREEGTLQQIKSHEQTAEEIEADELVTAVNSEGSSDVEREQDDAEGNTLKKVISKTTARKFVEEESREQGAVRKHIYLTYIKDSGGWLFWGFALFIYMTGQGLSIGKFLLPPLLLRPCPFVKSPY